MRTVLIFFFLSLSPFSNDASKDERPELVKKTYKWNTKEEAKQAFKELLKEKVRISLLSCCSVGTPA